jgi:hypothetical protein
MKIGPEAHDSRDLEARRSGPCVSFMGGSIRIFSLVRFFRIKPKEMNYLSRSAVGRGNF